MAFQRRTRKPQSISLQTLICYSLLETLNYSASSVKGSREKPKSPRFRQGEGLKPAQIQLPCEKKPYKTSLYPDLRECECYGSRSLEHM